MLRLAWGDHPFFGFSFPGERPTFCGKWSRPERRRQSAATYRSLRSAGDDFARARSCAAPDAVLARHYYACRLLARCDVAALLKELAVVKVILGRSLACYR